VADAAPAVDPQVQGGRYSTLEYGRVRYSAVEYGKVRYSTVEYGRVQTSMVELRRVRKSMDKYSKWQTQHPQCIQEVQGSRR
jgi:hypothetical protein